MLRPYDATGMPKPGEAGFSAGAHNRMGGPVGTPPPRQNQSVSGEPLRQRPEFRKPTPPGLAPGESKWGPGRDEDNHKIQKYGGAYAQQKARGFGKKRRKPRFAGDAINFDRKANRDFKY